MEIDDSEFHTGQQCFKIAAEDASGEPNSGKLLYRDMIPVEAEKTYTIAFWVRVDGDEAQNRPVQMFIENAATQWIMYSEEIILDSTDWKEYAYTFNTVGQSVRLSLIHI